MNDEFWQQRAKRRKKRLTQVFWITESALLISILYRFAFGVLEAEFHSFVTIMLLICFLTLVPVTWFIKNDKIKQGGNWLLITITIFQLGLIWHSAGLRDEILLITPALITFAIYIGSRYLFLWLFTIIVINIVALGYVNQAGIYINEHAGSGLYPAFNILIILAVICYTVWLVARDLNALNFKLLKTNKQLDEQVKDRTKHLEKSLAELKSTQEQLVEQEKMSSLGRLVAGVAHEVNTPIGISITSVSHLADNLQTISDKFKQNQVTRTQFESFVDNAQEAIKILLTNLTRAANLISSFKELAVDQTHDEIRTFNLKSYIEEILTSLKPEFTQTDIQVLAPQQDIGEIRSYPGALAHIITNIVLNAKIHAFKTNGVGNISITIAKQANMIEIQIHDDGCGMPELIVQNIFEPFFTTSRQHGGSGLGLHIAYLQATQKLQGSLKCNSTVEKGTFFKLTFPSRIN